MKFNKKYIWQRFLVTLCGVIPTLFIYISIFIADNEEGKGYSGLLGIDSSGKFLIGMLVVFLIYTIICYILSYLYWKKTTYEIGEQNITLEKGVLFKRKIIIEYENIHAINIDRPFVSILLGLSKLCIDSGNAATSHINEIEIVDIPDIISQMEKDIKEKMTAFKKQKIRTDINSIKQPEILKEDDSKKLSYTFSRKMQRRKIICSLSYVISFLFILIMTIVINILASREEDYTIDILVLSIIGALLFIIIVYLLSRLIVFLMYYNFNISYNKEEVIIQYGLVHKRIYYIDKSKIKALVFKQDIIQKMAGFGTIEVHMVGLAEQLNDQESAFIKLFPYIDQELLNKCIEELDIPLKFKQKESTCRKNSFIYFIALPFIVSFLLLIGPIIGIIIFDKYIGLIAVGAYLVILFIIFINGLLSKKNQSIDYDNDNIYISNGSFVKQMDVIPWKSVVHIGTRTTLLREKDNITSIEVCYYGDKTKASFIVKIQEMKTYGELLLYFESIKNK